MNTENEIPEHWKFRSTEVSAGVYKVTAVARDGRRIEATGFDGERLDLEVRASIKDSDEQIRKLIESKRQKTI